MPTRILGKASDEFANIVRQLTPEMLDILADEIQLVMDEIEKLYAKTFPLWGRSRHVSESDKSTHNLGSTPSVKWENPIVEIQIRGKRITATVELKSTVVDASGKPHEHWYRLDRGWPNITAQTNMVFPQRASQSTKPGSLDVTTPTYVIQDGDVAYRTIKAGNTRHGYVGNQWSETIANELVLTGKLSAWKIKQHATADPT